MHTPSISITTLTISKKLSITNMALPNNDIGEKYREALAAQAHIWNQIFNFINSMSLKCAIQLGIPDIIHSHGRPMTLSDLVDALPINNNNAKAQDCVYRLMRILIHAGFFIQEDEGYLLTPTSRLLLKDEPMSMIPLLQLQLDPIMMNPWHYLSKWFQNGDSSTPFVTAHGKPLYEYAEKEPKFSRLFNEAMASDAQLVASVMTEHCKGVFEGLKSLMDVGGGNGTLAKAFADAFPQINFTVFDLPHVIEECDEGIKNLTYVGGDMFKSIPSANAILLKWILHNWNDEECIKILKKCKEAIPSKENGGKVIIIDMVLMDHNPHKGDHKSYETQLSIDMLMMIITSGKQRNQQDWTKLFSNAGFSNYKIISILGLRSVIEVFP
ncbi:trans-resveratrol di-O-methyltransferase-like [Capsicum galapagoense]